MKLTQYIGSLYDYNMAENLFYVFNNLIATFQLKIQKTISL